MRDLTWMIALTLLAATVAKALASSDVATLERFAGVWIGVGIISQGPPSGLPGKASSMDVAIWESDVGFAMSWTSPSGEGIRRMTSQFVANRDLGQFVAQRVDPPLSANQDLWAEVAGNRLTVYLSDVVDAVEHLVRYDCFVVNGTITFKYTLSVDGEITESITGSLRRAKVVM